MKDGRLSQSPERRKGQHRRQKGMALKEEGPSDDNLMVTCESCVDGTAPATVAAGEGLAVQRRASAVEGGGVLEDAERGQEALRQGGPNSQKDCAKGVPPRGGTLTATQKNRMKCSRTGFPSTTPRDSGNRGIDLPNPGNKPKRCLQK